MNLERNPTTEELRDLLKSCDDRAGHHVLWVAKNGDVHVTRLPRDHSPSGVSINQPEVQLLTETFEAGNEYVGPEAAEDAAWIDQLFHTLAVEWPRAKGQPRVTYVNRF